MTQKFNQLDPQDENTAAVTEVDSAEESEQEAADSSQSERDLFDEDLLSGKKRSKRPDAPKKKKKKSKKGFIVLGVLCAVLAVCLGVLYFHLHQNTSKTAKIRADETAQLDDYTTLINNAALPEGWDASAFDALKQQALNVYDKTNLNLFEAADAGDDQARTQIEALEAVSAQPAADKFKTLFSNLSAYPSYAAAMLAKDPALIDFVLDMPNHPDGSAQDVDLDVSLETVPDLKTFDAKWGYVPYGNGTVADQGSAAAAIADVFSYLTKNPAITPLRVANFAKEYGYDLQPETEKDSLFTASGLNWGINANPLMPYQGQIDAALDYGNLVIARIGAPDSNTYMVISGKDDNGNWIVLDPSSSKAAESVSPETIKDQIQSAFAFYG